MIDEALNVGFQVGGDRNLSGFADQELSFKVPSGIGSPRLVLEELPDLGGGLSLDFPQLHEDSGKVFGLGKFRNGGVVVEFLPTKFTAGESKDYEFASVLLIKTLELGILAVG